MDEEDTRKRQTQEGKAGSSTGERPRWPETEEGSNGDLGEDLLPWFSADWSDGESVADLLKQVECTDATSTSLASWATTRVRFIDNPYSSQLIFQSSSYITINGNEETCGSSFSDSESSVMVSVDMGGILNPNESVLRGIEGLGVWFTGREKGLLRSSETEARGWLMGGGEGMEMGIDGRDGFDRNWGWEWDDVELGRFMGEETPFLTPNFE
ncbi:hypothetical protein SLE2022_268770 [Rubroshorea leprosula]